MAIENSDEQQMCEFSSIKIIASRYMAQTWTDRWYTPRRETQKAETNYALERLSKSLKVTLLPRENPVKEEGSFRNRQSICSKEKKFNPWCTTNVVLDKY